MTDFDTQTATLEERIDRARQLVDTAVTPHTVFEAHAFIDHLVTTFAHEMTREQKNTLANAARELIERTAEFLSE